MQSSKRIKSIRLQRSFKSRLFNKSALFNKSTLLNRAFIKVYVMLVFLLMGFGLMQKSFAESVPDPAINQLKQGYALVLFYESTCPHCQRFLPIVADVVNTYGLKIYPFTMNGGTLPSFANNTIPANDTIVNNFFQGASPVVPALYLVNVNTMDYMPLSQGEESEATLVQQLHTAAVHLAGASQ